MRFGRLSDSMEKIQRKTWYGLKATIIFGPGFMHTSGWGVFLIPHPPLANWLLRLGLKAKRRKALTFTHEFEHLQSAPLIFLYVLIQSFLVFSKKQADPSEIGLILLGSHAAWEIISEILTYFYDSSIYRSSYQEIPISPRILFWSVACLTVIVSWLIVLS